ncbi:MAG: transglutaminase-like domain-containing protein [Verrucomicrobiales bacterium]
MVLALAMAYALLRGYPSDWHGAARAALAVVVLALGVLIWLPRQGGDGVMLRSRRVVGWQNLGVVGSGLLLVELLLWAYFATMPSKMEGLSQGFHGLFLPGRGVESSEVGETSSGPVHGGWLINQTQSRPLPRRTNLKPGNRPEVFLQPQGEMEVLKDQRLYVHAFALSEFAEGAWSVGNQGRWELVADDDGWVNLRNEGAGKRVGSRVFHGTQLADQDLVIGFQGLSAVRLPKVEMLGEGMHLLSTPPNDIGGYSYDTLSDPVSLEDLVGHSVKVPELVSSRLFDQPRGSLGFRIADLTRLVQGEGGVVERLLKIRNHLRTTLDYSLVIENPENRDPLENFMFYEQRGHCEFFATAGALMARAAGVPSRVCYGWSGGTYYKSSGYFVFRAREAHAWAEVLLEGYGWVVFDPTPSGGMVPEAPRLAGPGEMPPGFNEISEELGGGEVMTNWWGPIVLFVGTAFVFWVLVIRALRTQSERARAKTRERAFQSDYLFAIRSACHARGMPVKPGTTLRALVASMDEAPEFVREMVDYHYSVKYEARPRDVEFEREMLRKVQVWSAG